MGLIIKTYKDEVGNYDDLLPGKDKPREEWTESELLAKRNVNAIIKGFKWRAVIINDKKEIQFLVPHMCKTESHAQRKGTQFLREYQKSGEWGSDGFRMIDPAKITIFGKK